MYTHVFLFASDEYAHTHTRMYIAKFALKSFLPQPDGQL